MNIPRWAICAVLPLMLGACMPYTYYRAPSAVLTGSNGEVIYGQPLHSNIDPITTNYDPYYTSNGYVDTGYHPYVSLFEPARGEGSNYAVGGDFSLQFNTTRDGYLTVISLNPNGYSNVLYDNLYVSAGYHTLPQSGQRITVTPPRGMQRVQAIFTPSNQNKWSRGLYLSGQYNYNNWINQLSIILSGNIDFSNQSNPSTDIRETYFYIY